MTDRVLVVKSSPEPEGLVWLDRLCNGLLSWARHRGLFNTTSESPWILLVPEYAPVARVYLWPEKKNFPWKDLPAEASKWSIVWAGDFSDDEIKEARKKFPGIAAWKSEGFA